MGSPASVRVAAASVANQKPDFLFADGTPNGTTILELTITFE